MGEPADLWAPYQTPLRIQLAKGIAPTGPSVIYTVPANCILELVDISSYYNANTTPGDIYFNVSGDWFYFDGNGATHPSSYQWTGHLIMQAGDQLQIASAGAQWYYVASGRLWAPFIEFG